MRYKLVLFNLLLVIVFAFSYVACSNTKAFIEKITVEKATTTTVVETKETIADSSDKIFALNDKINSIPSENTSQQRVDLLIQVDDFVKESVSVNGFSPDIYSLIKIRLDQALKEIPQIKVPKGKVKIWYIYNMGVIAKSEDKTIAIDLGGDYVYPGMADFTKYIDILVITHFHGDHINPSVFKEAVKNGVTVIVPGDKVLLKGDIFVRDPEGEDVASMIKKLNRVDWGNLISLKPKEKTTVKGVEITAYPAVHFHNPDKENSFIDIPVDWYYINLSGFTILHMGDGSYFNYQPDFTGKNIDVFITHSTNLDPRTSDTLAKLVPNPRIILPMHILELGHGQDILNKNSECYMTYQSILVNYSNGYYKESKGKTRFIPMIWGESILFQINDYSK